MSVALGAHLSESQLVTSNKSAVKSIMQGTAPKNSKSQQVRRISHRREPVSVVPARAQWGGSPLQPSKTTRDSPRRTSGEQVVSGGWRANQDSNWRSTELLAMA